MDNYNELQSKINSIECELARAKLELESSKKDDLIKEMNDFIGTALEEQDFFEKELVFNLTSTLTMIRAMLEDLIQNGETKDYSLAKTYYSSFKEKYLDLREKVRDLGTAKAALDTFATILKADKLLSQNKEKTEDYGIAPEVAEI